MRGVDSLGGGLIAWIGRRGLAHFWEGRDQRSWSISEAWASYARHGYAGWTGISSLDWVAGDRRNTGGRGISAVGLFRGRGHCMRGVYSLGGRGINSLDRVAGDYYDTGGCGISTVGLFRGRGHRMRSVDSLGGGVGINCVVKAAGYRRIYGGGGGLIALTEWLGIGAFTGRRGIGAVDSVV